MEDSRIYPMHPFERGIELNGYHARYYDLSELYSDATTKAVQEPTNNTKPHAHFYGGNGFAVGVYKPLLTALGDYFEMTSLAMRGYWYDRPTDKVLTRAQDAEVLIEYIEKTQDTPIIGIGHSQGATATAMAAAKRPDLFSALYLIDPVTFTKSQTLLYGLIPRQILLTQEPFKSTKAKQAEWASVDDYYTYLRKHRAFKRINDDNLYTFANNSLVKHADGSYRLLFEPQYELASYFGTPYITPALKTLTKLKVPYKLILAKPSMFNSTKVRSSWQGIVPKDNWVTLADYGHLLPMEAPETCAQLIFAMETSRR